MRRTCGWRCDAMTVARGERREGKAEVSKLAATQWSAAARSNEEEGRGGEGHERGAAAQESTTNDRAKEMAHVTARPEIRPTPHRALVTVRTTVSVVALSSLAWRSSLMSWPSSVVPNAVDFSRANVVRFSTAFCLIGPVQRAAVV